MRTIFQLSFFILGTLVAFILIHRVLKRRWPNLGEHATGTISCVLALIAMILLVLLIYPQGWS
jgi:hypothetical protein